MPRIRVDATVHTSRSIGRGFDNTVSYLRAYLGNVLLNVFFRSFTVLCCPADTYLRIVMFCRITKMYRVNTVVIYLITLPYLELATY